MKIIRLYTANIVVAVFIPLFYCNALATGAKKQTFKVVLENVRRCPDPNPPYMNVPPIFTEYNITTVNGKRYLSGNSTITEPTPFRNFSGRTFTVDSSGRFDVKMEIQGVSCKNVFARSILLYSNIGFTKRTCMLHKGFFQYNLDLDRIMHGLPSWHSPGTILHQLQMATNVSTIFCNEIFVKVVK